MVAGVRGVDRDKRQVAQVGAVAKVRGHLPVGLGDHVVGEGVGDAVLVDRDERHGLRRRRVAQPRDDTRLRQAKAVLWPDPLGLDQFAVLRAVGLARGHQPFAIRALVDGHKASALGRLAEHAKDLERVRPDAPDHPRLVGVAFGVHLGHAGEDAVAIAQRGVAVARDDQDARLGPLALPFEWTGEEVAVGIRRHHQDRDGRQPVTVAVGLSPLLELAVLLEFLQHALQVDPRGALDPEGLRDVALRGLGRVSRDPFQDLVFRGHAGHGPSATTPAACGHGAFGGGRKEKAPPRVGRRGEVVPWSGHRHRR